MQLQALNWVNIAPDELFLMRQITVAVAVAIYIECGVDRCKV